MIRKHQLPSQGAQLTSCCPVEGPHQNPAGQERCRHVSMLSTQEDWPAAAVPATEVHLRLSEGPFLEETNLEGQHSRWHTCVLVPTAAAICDNRRAHCCCVLPQQYVCCEPS